MMSCGKKYSMEEISCSLFKNDLTFSVCKFFKFKYKYVTTLKFSKMSLQ